MHAGFQRLSTCQRITSDRALPVACFLEPRTLSRVGTTPRGQWEVPKDGVERSYLSVLCDSIATAAAEPELDP
ncbi:Unconventional Myosin-Ib [Manis pentadactyla]|nr:Unconventional Myosin-Ib [Manis pentadactyla]